MRSQTLKGGNRLNLTPSHHK